jgi:hypothetical protein
MQGIGVAMETPLLPLWKGEAGAHWGRIPVKLPHRLQASPEFAPATLADLIEAQPRVGLTLTGAALAQGRLYGARLIERVATEKLSLSLLAVERTDPSYRAILETLYDQLALRVPVGKPRLLSMEIVLAGESAPMPVRNAACGEIVFQIEGRQTLNVMEPGLAGDNVSASLVLNPGDMAHAPILRRTQLDRGAGLRIFVRTTHWTVGLLRASRPRPNPILHPIAALREAFGYLQMD